MENHGNWWTYEIKSKIGWFDFSLADIWRYRDLMMLFVRRDIVTVYKQTILGPLWFVIQPLFTTATFIVVFGRVAKLPTGGIPALVFYMTGVVLWTYFAECLIKTSQTFINNTGIFGKVYFPRIIMPASYVISHAVRFVIQLCLLLMIFAYYKFVEGADIAFTWYMLLFPLIVLCVALLGLSFGIIVSALTTKYRDLSFLVTFGVQLLMYATPVAYSYTSFPEKLQPYVFFNPMSGLIETTRFALTGKGYLDLNMLAYSFGFTSIILVLGFLIFNKVEKNFMDVI